MNDTKIEWCDMTWNPVTGCLHGCEYCYAKKVAHRFDGKVFDTSPLPGGLHVLEDRPPWPPYPYGFAPTFHRYRLGDPASKTKGKTIFVCSMADLFGPWVPTKWIVDVMDACLAAPQHRYLFLTKFPERYLKLESTDFFTAPASTRFHLSRPGGLVEHSVHVYERLSALKESEWNFHPDMDLSDETIAIVGLLHDICKANFYGVEMRNRKNEQGKWEQYPFYIVNDRLPYGHGEKSVYIISSFMKLSREEAMAIRWHMGFSDNEFKAGGYSVGNAFEMFPLAVLTHVADLQATYLDEAEDGQ